MKRVEVVKKYELKETRLWVESTQWSIQMLYYKVIYLELI